MRLAPSVNIDYVYMSPAQLLAVHEGLTQKGQSIPGITLEFLTTTYISTMLNTWLR